MPSDDGVTGLNIWGSETTDDPVIADHRNFYKVELWTPTSSSVVCGGELSCRLPQRRPTARLTVRQRSRVLEQSPKDGG
jgi:hypothetical protein